MYLKIYIIFMYACVFTHATKEESLLGGIEMDQIFPSTSNGISNGQNNNAIDTTSSTQSNQNLQQNNGNSQSNNFSQMHSYGNGQQQNAHQNQPQCFQSSSTLPTIPVGTNAGQHRQIINSQINQIQQNRIPNVINQWPTPNPTMQMNTSVAQPSNNCFQRIYRMVPPPVNPSNGVLDTQNHRYFLNMDSRQLNTFTQFRTLGQIVRSGLIERFTFWNQQMANTFVLDDAALLLIFMAFGNTIATFLHMMGIGKMTGSGQGTTVEQFTINVLTTFNLSSPLREVIFNNIWALEGLAIGFIKSVNDMFIAHNSPILYQYVINNFLRLGNSSQLLRIKNIAQIAILDNFSPEHSLLMHFIAVFLNYYLKLSRMN